MADVFHEVEVSSLPFPMRAVRSGPHENFHFILADPESRQTVVVDPAFHVDRIAGRIEKQGWQWREAWFTHGHWDHIGGIPSMFDHGVETVRIHRAAAGHPKVKEAEAAGADVRLFHDGDRIGLGGLRVEVMHTPGHQPESSCFLVGAAGGPQALFTGDTLFIDTCGRTDFPGGDTDAMFASMARLRSLASPDTFVLPGHDYADRPFEDLAMQSQLNPALATTDRAAFGRLHCLTH